MVFNTWEKVTLGEVAFVTKLAGFEYTKYLSENFLDRGVPVIQGRNIKNNKLNFDSIKYISKDLSDSLDRSKVNMGDILFSYVGTVGDVYLHNSSQQIHLGSNVAKISILNKKEVFNKYIFYTLQAIDTTNKISSKTKGSVQSNINMADLRSIEINLPPYNEQKAIAQILLTLDEKIETNNQINRNLEEMAETLFKHWFVDFEFPNEDGEPYKSSGGEMVESELGMIPKGWEVGRFIDYIDVLSGGTPKTTAQQYWDGDIPFFTPKDSRGMYCINTEKTITEIGLNRCNSKLYDINTVFITARGTVGKVCIAGKRMAMNQSCYALVGKDNVNQYLVYLLTKKVADELQRNASGSVFDAIIVDTFKSIRVARPGNEQLEAFERVMEPIYSTILTLYFENEKLGDIRDTLLPKLMSGEIRVPLDQEGEAK